MSVFELEDHGFNSWPGQLFFCDIGAQNSEISHCQRYGVVVEKRDLLWIGMIPGPSAEEDVQCSRTNTDLEGENVVECSVRGLGDYCPFQWA